MHTVQHSVMASWLPWDWIILVQCIYLAPQSLSNHHQIVMVSQCLCSGHPYLAIHTVKGFSVVNEAKGDFFSNSLAFFYDPAMWKPLTVRITTNWKTVKRDGNTRPPYLPPEKLLCRSRNNSLYQTWKNEWFKIGKSIHQGCILSPAYLTCIQSLSCEIPDWINHILESRLPGEI